MINKYDMIDNHVIESYPDITSAAQANGLCYRSVHREVRGEKNFQCNRRPYYFSEKPLQHKIIVVYDNMYFDEVGRYWSIKTASQATGVDMCTIQNQLSQDQPLQERYCGCTGLWFKYMQV